MKKNFFKRSMKVVLGVTMLASVLGGCNEMPVEIGNEAPTVTVAPTNEVLEPTKEVLEPTKAVAEPTQEVEPTVAPTEEPEVTPAFSLTVVPTPTEEPEPTEVPVVTEELTPTEQPKATATVAPTATPKPTATAKPKATVTPKTTSKPKATAVPKATATPKPTSGWGKHVNKNAKNYKLITEELGLPGEIDSKFINYDEQFGYYSVDFWTSFSENGCPKYKEVNKTLYTKTTAFAADAKRDINIASVLEDAYFTVITEHAENNDFSQNTVFRNKLEKGQELTAVAYYPEWNIYKVKFNETKEYFVFGGQVSEKKPSGLDVHEYLAMELEDGEYVVTGLVAGATQTDIIIPSEINGIPVTKIADGAFDVQGKNFTVTLSDSITYIGDRAFSECKITNTALPKALEHVGKSAFWRTDAEFKSLPQSVNYIGDYAFQECAINKVVIPKEMTKVPDNAFKDCVIKELTLHDNITRIGSHAFNALDLGEDEIINLPKKITYIGDNGIWGNYGGIKLQGKMPEHLFELRGEVDILVDTLVSGWEKKHGKLSDLEYTLLAFDWVTKNVNDTTYAGKFLQGESITTVGEAMLNGRGNCYGTLLAVKELLDRAGVENYATVASMPGHGWNIVVIGDTQYHMDATWGVFLSSDKEFVNTGCYDGKEIDYSRIDKEEYPAELEGVVIIPNCPKSFPSNEIASAKARLGLK